MALLQQSRTRLLIGIGSLFLIVLIGVLIYRAINTEESEVPQRNRAKEFYTALEARDYAALQDATCADSDAQEVTSALAAANQNEGALAMLLALLLKSAAASPTGGLSAEIPTDTVADVIGEIPLGYETTSLRETGDNYLFTLQIKFAGIKLGESDVTLIVDKSNEQCVQQIDAPDIQALWELIQAAAG